MDALIRDGSVGSESWRIYAVLNTMKSNRARYAFIALALLVVGVALILLAKLVENSGSSTTAPVFSEVAESVEWPAVEVGITEEREPDSRPLQAEVTMAAADSVVPDSPEMALCDPRVDVERHFCQRGWSVDRTSPLRGRILVGLYGTPLGRGLGILGTVSPTATVRLAREQAEAYRVYLTDTVVLPYFHMVTTIADAFPGDDGDYNHRVVTSTIQHWIDVARAHGLSVVLDIQPGRGMLATELDYVKPFLQQRGVHLALDPEFAMQQGAVPGERIGRMDAEDVNLAQAWLSERAWEAGERKILIIHQFDDRMFGNKEHIRSLQYVELVWDADGFGGPAAKVADYSQYAAEPGFEYGGFKLFYDYDEPLMTPLDVLRLSPRPAVIVYQ